MTILESRCAEMGIPPKDIWVGLSLLRFTEIWADGAVFLTVVRRPPQIRNRASCWLRPGLRALDYVHYGT